MGLFGGFRSSFGGLFGGFFSFRRFTFWGFRSGSVIVEGTIDVDDEAQGDLAVASLQNAQELMGFPVLAMSSSRVGVEPAASKTETWYIYVAIFGGLLIIASIIGLILYCRNLNKNEAKEDGKV